MKPADTEKKSWTVYPAVEPATAEETQVEDNDEEEQEEEEEEEAQMLSASAATQGASDQVVLDSEADDDP
eukprot:SAG31_NODE_23749_length_497_cov_0.871859_1_plen_69_part_10